MASINFVLPLLLLLLFSTLTPLSTALPIPTRGSSYRGAGSGFIVKTYPTIEQQREQASHGFWGLHAPTRYRCFNGGNDDAADALSESKWKSFDDLWRINQPTILTRNGGDTYLEHYIKQAILEVADESAVDSRLILAVIMQESSGRVQIPCKSTRTGGAKCGLMQVTNGHSFSEFHAQSSILQMVRDGVEGEDLDRALDADERYLSDVANRLLGWEGRGPGFRTCHR